MNLDAFHGMLWLASQDYVVIREGDSDKCFSIIVNDLFVTGKDSEPVPEKYWPDIVEIYKQHDYDGLLDWVCEQRGEPHRFIK